MKIVDKSNNEKTRFVTLEIESIFKFDNRIFMKYLQDVMEILMRMILTKED